MIRISSVAARGARRWDAGGNGEVAVYGSCGSVRWRDTAQPPGAVIGGTRSPMVFADPDGNGFGAMRCDAAVERPPAGCGMLGR